MKLNLNYFLYVVSVIWISDLVLHSFRGNCKRWCRWRLSWKHLAHTTVIYCGILDTLFCFWIYREPEKLHILSFLRHFRELSKSRGSLTPVLSKWRKSHTSFAKVETVSHQLWKKWRQSHTSLVKVEAITPVWQKWRQSHTSFSRIEAVSHQFGNSGGSLTPVRQKWRQSHTSLAKVEAVSHQLCKSGCSHTSLAEVEAVSCQFCQNGGSLIPVW